MSRGAAPPYLPRMPGVHVARAATIRVVIAGVPGLLASIVCDILRGEADIEVVAQVASAGELEDVLGHNVDVVVTTAGVDALTPALRALLFGRVPVPVVAISADGRRIDVFGHTVRHDRGIDGLTELIREAVAESRPRIGG